MVDSFTTLKNYSSCIISFVPLCNRKRPFWGRNVLLSETVYHVSYAQGPSNTYKWSRVRFLFHKNDYCMQICIHTPAFRVCITCSRAHLSQMFYLGSLLGLYFPYDFCLYPNATAVEVYAIKYIPFMVALVVCTVFGVLTRYVCMIVVQLYSI